MHENNLQQLAIICLSICLISLLVCLSQCRHRLSAGSKVIRHGRQIDVHAFCRLQLEVEMFRHLTTWTNQSKIQ